MLVQMTEHERNVRAKNKNAVTITPKEVPLQAVGGHRCPRPSKRRANWQARREKTATGFPRSTNASRGAGGGRTGAHLSVWEGLMVSLVGAAQALASVWILVGVR